MKMLVIECQDAAAMTTVTMATESEGWCCHDNHPYQSDLVRDVLLSGQLLLWWLLLLWRPLPWEIQMLLTLLPWWLHQRDAVVTKIIDVHKSSKTVQLFSTTKPYGPLETRAPDCMSAWDASKIFHTGQSFLIFLPPILFTILLWVTLNNA